MAIRKYSTPVLFDLDDETETGGVVVGGGTGQGTYIPEGALTFEEWWELIAQEGTNPDANYNGDNVIDRADYDYYIANELWKGGN